MFNIYCSKPKLYLTDVGSSIPVCARLSYEAGVCFCLMDQCLESVRYQHMEVCGNTTAPTMDTAPLEETSNSTSNETQSQYNEEKHLGEMFEWV